jgi:hypothetical protein
VPWAPWFGIQAVSLPSAPHTAAADRDSIGAGATRWLRIVLVTTTSQPSNRSLLAALSSPNLMTSFVPASGNRRPVSPSLAAFMSTTAGRIS